jgi:acyl CoA:acetate/3-ketoacid CoA transferase beta subunit
VGVDACRSAGRTVELTAELGMLGYRPTPADPYIFNHRVFPSTPMLADASCVLGMVVGGPGTRTVGCLGAAQVDRDGNLNSTLIPGGPFLVGSGGANDVASRAAGCVVVALANPGRLVERVGYVTSPGHNVMSVVTDLGILRRLDGELRLAAVAAGDASHDERVAAMAGGCGWPVPVCRQVEELAPVSAAEVLALRRHDPERLFLA